jgi:hypothetical protein
LECSYAQNAAVGLMKCDALISRGSRKDFYDLFFISREIPFDNIPWDEVKQFFIEQAHMLNNSWFG